MFAAWRDSLSLFRLMHQFFYIIKDTSDYRKAQY